MFERMKQFYQLFSYGRQVSNPEFWKKGQAVVQPIVAALIMFIVAIAKGFGYELPISDELAVSLAGGVFFIVNSVLTIISSKHIGIKPSMPEASVRETIQAVPSDEPATDVAEPLPHISEASARQRTISTIDDDTRRRAVEWARGHSPENRFQNDA